MQAKHFTKLRKLAPPEGRHEDIRRGRILRDMRNCDVTALRMRTNPVVSPVRVLQTGCARAVPGFETVAMDENRFEPQPVEQLQWQ